MTPWRRDGCQHRLRAVRRGMFVVLVSGLTACGFHLRGAGDGGALAVDGLYVDQGKASAQLVTVLSRAATTAGATVTDNRETAKLVVTLQGEQRDRRVLSVGTGGKVQEYELHYAVRFAATDGTGRTLLEAQTISLVRDLTFSDAQVLAKGNEEDRLYEDMRRDAVRQIILRLNSSLTKE
jgi:LPS-assembly lipoprotein